MPARIIALANQKGGVGKTTTSVNLAACLAERGRKVLLIDFDPQANTTSGVGIEKLEGRSLYAALLDNQPIESLIVETQCKRLELIPSEVDLAGAEVEIARMDRYLHRLKEILHPLAATDRFEYILIDCPPSLGILTMNALTSAHSLIMPIQCEYYALEGLSVMLRLVQQLRDNAANSQLEIEGVVMTMYDMRTNLSQQVVQQVTQHLGEKVYETLIPRSVRLGEAPSFGKPVILYDKHCTGSAAYRQLAREFLTRRKAVADAPDEDVAIETPEPTPAPAVEPAPTTEAATTPPATPSSDS